MYPRLVRSQRRILSIVLRTTNALTLLIVFACTYTQMTHFPLLRVYK